RRRRRVLLAPAAVAGIAGGTAVVLAVGMGGSGPRHSPPTPVRLDATSVFLAAADQAERQPMGEYWYTDQIQGQSYIVKDGYAIVGAHSETFEWTAVKAGGGNVFYGRDLPARPATKEDRAAWRKAGSPSSFRVWSNDHHETYTTRAGSWQEDPSGDGTGGRFFVQGSGRELTVKEILKLPTDPATLAARFLTLNPPGRPGRRQAVPPLSNAYKLNKAAELFESAPLPPKVRAGLMRALVTQPDVRAIGLATDPLGRQGIAVAVDQPSWGWSPGPDGKLVRKELGYAEREELIFDRGTGALLAEQAVLVKPGGEYRTRKPGFVINYWLTRASNWTDDKPSPPKKLPLFH
ncbi:CU044_5270 family protein, partial [Actinoallomurus acaciae]